MLHKSLAATLTLLLMTVSTRAAFASPPAAGRTATAQPPAELTETLTVLHAVIQWSTSLSAMADKRAKSGLVRDFAREVATSGADKDAKLMDIAKQHGIDVAPLDPQTEQGKSLLERMKGETVLLGSLEGDAFDKEYMTLVTNTQQSVIQFLKVREAAAKDPAVKKFMGNMMATVQHRLKTAQDIMAKVYGHEI